MKQLVRNVYGNFNLYRDDATGIAWIKDEYMGRRINIHRNIYATSSVKSMKERGHWKKTDRTVKCNGFIYNIDSLDYDIGDKLENIVADECRCIGCLERRYRELRDRREELYRCLKEEVDRHFVGACGEQGAENKRDNAIECIYYIGRAMEAALILETDFRENFSAEREHMRKVKDYVQLNML